MTTMAVQASEEGHMAACSAQGRKVQVAPLLPAAVPRTSAAARGRAAVPLAQRQHLLHFEGACSPPGAGPAGRGFRCRLP